MISELNIVNVQYRLTLYLMLSEAEERERDEETDMLLLWQCHAGFG